MTIITSTLTFTAEKKHSARYDDDSRDAPVKSLYISKSAMPSGGWPRTVTVTLDFSPTGG